MIICTIVSGGYICYVTHGAQNLTSPETRLLVREKTKPKRHLPNLSVLEGSGNVYMRCSFTYDFALHDSLEISWIFYNGDSSKNIHTNSTGRVQGKAVQGRALILTFPYRKISTTYLTLTIEDVSLEDDGWYTCVAKTRLDSAVTQTGRLDVKKKTEIIKNPAHVMAVQGGAATLLCIVSIDSSLLDDTEVYWTHSGRSTLEDRNNIEVFGHQKQKLTHKISEVTPQDQGLYRCHVITPFDSSQSRYARLDVKTGSYMIEEPQSVEAPTGGVAVFTCLAQTDPSLAAGLVMSWSRNGQPLINNPNKIQIQESGTKLVISQLNHEDSGEITCHVKTSLDSLKSKVALLSILRPTTIVEQSQGEKEIPEGSDLSLECRVETDPKLEQSLTVKWFYNDEPLEDDHRVDPQGPKHIDIKIKSAQLSDSGSYQCIANTYKDEDKSKVVKVLVRKKTAIEVSQGRIDTLEGGKVTLNCNYNIDKALQSSLEVKWFKDRIELKEDDKIVKGLKDIIIQDVETSDSGTYACKVSTKIDQVESEPVTVEVYKNSRLISEPENKKVFEMSEVVLTCEAEIDNRLMEEGIVWTWKQNGQVVKTKSSKRRDTSYIIQKVNKEDSAFYSCELKTKLEILSSEKSSLRVYSQTKISKHPKSKGAVHGNLVEFECTAEVDPQLATDSSISWFKDGKLVSARNPLYSVLPLESVSGDDAGLYTCKVITPIGHKSSSADLIIKEKTKILTKPFKGDKLEGQNISLRCDFQTDPLLNENVQVQWFKDGKLIEDEMNNEIFLTGLEYEDTGDYKCLIKTELDKAELVHSLVVYKNTAVNIPEVFTDRKSVTGKLVELECTVVADPKLRKSLNITWTRDNHIIGPGEIFWGSEFDATSRLRVDNVRKSDSGKYACSASTWLDSSVVEVGRLTIWEATTFITPPTTVEVVQGAKASLDCEVTVDQELKDGLQFSWLKDDDVIDTSQGGEGNFRLEENNTLTIFSANEESAGSYTCQVSTELDTETLVHNLKVLEKSKVIKHPRHIKVKQGESFFLECAVHTDPELVKDAMVTWRHNKKDMAESSAAWDQAVGTSTLSLVATDATTGGRYDCVAATRLDSVTSRAAYVTVDGNHHFSFVFFTIYYNILQSELTVCYLPGLTGAPAVYHVEVVTRQE